MKAGRVYRSFLTKEGRRVTLRAARWEDLDNLVEFANGLVAEHEENSDFGVTLSKPVTRDEQAGWLAKKLVRIEQGKEISVVAEVDGRVVGNSEVIRGEVDDISANGRLGIALAKGYRGIGMGTEMLRSLIELSRDAGLKTLQLEVFSTNPRAQALYRKVGFKRAGLLKGKVRRGPKVIDAIVMTMDLE